MMHIVNAQAIRVAWAWANARLTENYQSQSCAFNRSFKKGRAEHFIGCVTEDFVAQVLDIEWTGRFNTKAERRQGHIRDVGFIEVKSTSYCSSRIGKLIINSWDPDDAVYILVYTGKAFIINDDYVIKCCYDSKLIGLGWAYGHEIKRFGEFKISNGKPSHWMHHESEHMKSFDHPQFLKIVEESQDQYGRYTISPC